MSKINIELLLAKRLAGERKGVMTRIATISVAIGLSVMILSLSIIFGFKHEIEAKMTGVLADVQIRNYESEFTPISSSQPFTGEITQLDGFVRMNRYALASGIVRSENAMQGVVIKGIGGDFDFQFFENCLVDGAIPSVTDSTRTKQVLISKKLSSITGIKTGDKLEILTVQNPPRRDLFKVSGIYETDLSEIDNNLIVGDIRDVQRINRWDTAQISGYEISISDFKEVSDFSNKTFDLLKSMADKLSDEIVITNIRESYPVIFDWLDTHDLNAAIIIIVMLLVAAFNIIASLLIIILDKSAMIGVLKALGMKNSSVRQVFVLRSAYIIAGGMFWGNLIGIGLSLLQQHTGILKLSAEGYFLTQVPIFIDWSYIILLNIGVFAITILMMILPATIVSRISPERTIKME